MKKNLIFAAILLLSMCNRSFAQDVDEPTPDMIRHGIRWGKVKEIYNIGADITDSACALPVLPITFNEAGHENRDNINEDKVLFDSHDRRTFSSDLWGCDTIVYENEFDKRPMFRIFAANDLESDSMYITPLENFGAIPRRYITYYERFFYHGPTDEPYASLSISDRTEKFLNKHIQYCEYTEYTYTQRDTRGNWTRKTVKTYRYDKLDKAITDQLFDPNLNPAQRKRLEKKLIKTIKSKATKTEEDYTRYMIYD